MLKKTIMLSGIIAGSMLYANTSVNLTANQTYLSKSKVLNILKKIPNDNKLIQDYKTGKVKVYVQNINPDYYGLVIKKGFQTSNAFMSKNEKYLILGRIIDLKTQKILTAHPPVNVEAVKKGVVFTFGKGKKVIYVVTDPECPFCKRLFDNKKAMSELNNNYKINVILYPLSFHKYSKEMSLYVLAGKTAKERHQRLEEMYKGSNAFQKVKYTKVQKEKLEKELNLSKNAAKALSFTGTPEFFDSNFNQISFAELAKNK